MLLGHTEAEQTLAQAWRGGRLHHAWLLTGPAGIGKATLACRFAELVLYGLESATGALLAGTHPDLLVIARANDDSTGPLQRAEMTLDDVRPIGGFLRRTAAAGGWRVVIVEGVDRMSRHAANTMLKLIEEPPSRVLLLLICDAPGRLLPTLRSRCRRLRLSPLEPETMNAVLLQRLPDATDTERQTLIALSGGSPGRALALAAEGGVALSTFVQQALARDGQEQGLWSYDLADAVLRHENGFSTFLDLLPAAISGIMRACSQSAQSGDDVASMMSSSLERWEKICSTLALLREQTERFNLDKRQALLVGLSLLSEP